MSPKIIRIHLKEHSFWLLAMTAKYLRDEFVFVTVNIDLSLGNSHHYCESHAKDMGYLSQVLSFKVMQYTSFYSLPQSNLNLFVD